MRVIGLFRMFLLLNTQLPGTTDVPGNCPIAYHTYWRSRNSHSATHIAISPFQCQSPRTVTKCAGWIPCFPAIVSRIRRHTHSDQVGEPSRRPEPVTVITDQPTSPAAGAHRQSPDEEGWGPLTTTEHSGTVTCFVNIAVRLL